MMRSAAILLCFLFTALSSVRPQEADAYPVLNPGDLRLEDCLEAALTANPLLDELRAALKARGAAIALVKTARRPDLAASAGYQVQDENLLEGFGGPPPEQNSWALDLTSGITLYSAGRFGLELAISEWEERAEAARFLGEADAILRDVRIRYAEAAHARRVIELRRETLDVLQENLRQAEQRLAGGAATPLEKLQAASALAAEQPEYLRALHHAEESIELLWRSIGLAIPSPWKPMEYALSTELPAPEFVEDIEASLSRALTGRAELIELDALIQAALRQSDLVHKATAPRLRASGGYGARSRQFSDDQDDEVLHGWTLGIQGTWTLYDAGVVSAKALNASATLASLEASRRGLLLDIEREVRAESRACRQAIDVITAAESSLKTAQEAYRLATSRYAAGGATQLDVLDARRQITAAESARHEALRDFAVALARFQHSLGPISP